jgi:hypothetical protein
LFLSRFFARSTVIHRLLHWNETIAEKHLKNKWSDSYFWVTALTERTMMILRKFYYKNSLFELQNDSEKPENLLLVFVHNQMYKTRFV